MPSKSDNIDMLIACPECDLLLERIHVAPRFNAHCPRCGHLLAHAVAASVDKILALSCAGLFLSVPAYLLPILKLDLLDTEQTVSLVSGVLHLFRSGYWLVAVAVLLTSIVLPMLKKLLLLYLSWNLKLGRRDARKSCRSRMALAFRCYHYVAEWSMSEVFILGVTVSAIKLRDMGDLHPGFGLYCFISVLSVSLLQTLNLDSALFWKLIERVGDERRD